MQRRATMFAVGLTKSAFESKAGGRSYATGGASHYARCALTAPRSQAQQLTSIAKRCDRRAATGVR